MRLRHWVYTVPLRLRSIFERRQVERELDEELEFHIALKTDEYCAKGMTPGEARRAALRDMDGLTQRKEECRDMRRVAWFDNTVQDIRYGMRSLRNAPAFTVVAVLTLAAGIGANTAIFTVIDKVLLRPLDFPEPDRIMQITLFSPGWAQGKTSVTLSLAEFNVIREQRKVFDEIAAWDAGKGVNLTGVAAPEQLKAMHVNADYFPLFGARATVGRTFTAKEDRPGGPNVALISGALRDRRFAAKDPVGKVLTLEGAAYTIVGVLDRSFATHDTTRSTPDVFLPLRADPASTNPAHVLHVAARLKPGITPVQARARLQVAHAEFLRRLPNWTSRSVRAEGFTAEPIREAIVGESRRPLLLLAGAVGLVLLIACANVASLLMARGSARKREIAVRAALGANRSRIISQLFTESMLLSIGGGVLALLAGSGCIRVLMAIRPAAIPRLDETVGLNAPVLAFTLLLAIATGLMFGILPAFSSVAQLENGTDLIATGARSGTGVRQKRARALLVVAEIALGMVLLTGAGLLIRTFSALRTVDPGFDARDLLTMEMSLAGTEFEAPAKLTDLIRDAERRVERLPGVIAIAATYSLPLENQLGGPLAVEGHPEDRYGTNEALVSWRYFDVFRIPIREGRSFGVEDDRLSPPVAIINGTMARGQSEGMRWSSVFPWRGGSPIGERVTMGKAMGPPFEDRTRQIIGVVSEVHDTALNRNPIPMLYVPIGQIPDGFARMASRGLPLRWVVRTHGDPWPFRAAIERELATASGGLPLAHVRAMEQIRAEATARDRFNMILLSAFAGIALLLGGIGVYGLMAYVVQHRTQEIGVRIALGARPFDVRLMVVFEGIRLALAGVALGIAGALAVTPVMQTMLFGVEPRDPAIIVSTAAVLTAAALLATSLPAWRATRVDPVTALRWE
jgi:predicted permease